MSRIDKKHPLHRSLFGRDPPPRHLFLAPGMGGMASLVPFLVSGEGGMAPWTLPWLPSVSAAKGFKFAFGGNYPMILCRVRFPGNQGTGP